MSENNCLRDHETWSKNNRLRGHEAYRLQVTLGRLTNPQLYEILDSLDRITLCLDNDNPFRLACEEVINIADFLTKERKLNQEHRT